MYISQTKLSHYFIMEHVLKIHLEDTYEYIFPMETLTWKEGFMIWSRIPLQSHQLYLWSSYFFLASLWTKLVFLS